MYYIQILVEFVALLPVLASTLTWSGDGLSGSLKTHGLPMHLLHVQGATNQRLSVKQTPITMPRNVDILMPELWKSKNLENVSTCLDSVLGEPAGKGCDNLSNSPIVDDKERSVAPLPDEGLAVSSKEESVVPLRAEGLAVSSKVGSVAPLRAEELAVSSKVVSVAPFRAERLAVSSKVGSVAPLRAEGLVVSSKEDSVAPLLAKELSVSSTIGSVTPLRVVGLAVSSEGESVAPLSAEGLAVSSNWRSQQASGGGAPARAAAQGRAAGDGGTSAVERPASKASRPPVRGWGTDFVNTTEDADLQSAPIRDASNYIENIYLWTRYYNSAVGYEVLDLDDIGTLASSRFVISSPTIILVHGFLSHGLIEWILTIKDKFIAMIDCNVISVHWSAGTSNVQYYTVTGRVPFVAQGIARLVNQMHILKQVRPDQIYLVGHSLGAHVAGFVGKRNKLEPIGRITGLDPAGLTYDNTDAGVRLDKRDAIYVDIIHTNGCNNNNKWFDCFGISNTIGHTDFWPNGGEYQPACSNVRRRELHQRRRRSDRRTDKFVGCDHEMAHKYYMESLDYSDSTTLFLARPMTANTGAEQLNVSCGHFPQYMGYYADLRYGDGDYFLVTGASSPFAHSDDSCPSRYSPHRLATTTRWIIGVAAVALGAALVVVPLATLLTRKHAADAVDQEYQPILPGEGEQEGELGGERPSNPSLQQV